MKKKNVLLCRIGTEEHSNSNLVGNFFSFFKVYLNKKRKEKSSLKFVVGPSVQVHEKYLKNVL